MSSKRFHWYLPSIALAAALASSGCVTRAGMDARYEQSLQRWKGSTRAALVAQWGKPVLVQDTAAGTTLTWVVHDDFENRGVMPQYVSSGGGAPVMLAGSVVSTTSITCTTRFLLRDGVVESWTFEGLGCGAPT